MIGPGPRWRRPPAEVPPWVAAIGVVVGFLFLINALPMLASALTPDRETAPAAIGSPPSPVPLPTGRPTAAPNPLPDPLPLDSASSVRDSGGTGAAGGGSSSDGAAGNRTPDGRSPDGATTVRGLPWAGGHSGPALVVGLVLLSGGLGLLKVVGCSGERPWPGRYVRRAG